MTLFFALLIGILNGLRSFTAPAVTSWGARLGWLKLQRPFSLIGLLPVTIALTALALVELVFDKLPKTPARTELTGLIARAVMGALTGACVAAGGGVSAIIGALLGVVGALAGAFGGYQVRTRLVRATGKPDFYIALLEDIVAIGGSLWVVSRF